MNKADDNVLVKSARKAVAIELATKRAMGFSVSVFDSKTKTIYTKMPNGDKVDIVISQRGRYSEHRK